MLYDMFAEVLPRLGCINVAVRADDVNANEASESVLGCLRNCFKPRISVIDGDKLKIGESVVRIPCHVDSSVSGLVEEEDEGRISWTTFRLKLSKSDQLPELIRPDNVYNIRVRAAAPSIKPDVHYTLQCSSCHQEIGEVKPSRLLPAPSSGWRSHSLDW